MAKIGNQELTQGWYITGGIAVGIALGNTKAAPIVLGILTVALIYQLTNLLEGIPPGGAAPSGIAGIGGSGSAPVTSSTSSTPIVAV
jgi:hypothetical protein